MGLTRQQIIMLLVLISGTFITILNQTLVNPALPTIMVDTGVDASTVQWLTAGFTMVNAIMIPVSAYLTDRFSVRNLYITAISVFLGGTLLCAWGANFPMLLASRLVQAMGAGVLMPMVLTVLLLTFSVERRGFAMGMFGIIIMFAPAIGPVAAGLIIDNANWHVMFLVVAVLVAADIVFATLCLKREEKAVPENLTLDKPSVLMSTVGFGGMLYGFSVIGSSGVSVGAIVAVVIGLGVTVLFFRRQFRLEVPMLQVRVLKNRTFLVGTIISMMVQAGIMANSVLVPIYVQNLCGQTATMSGLVLLPGAIVSGVMSPVSGKIFDKRGPRTMSIVGMVILCTSSFAMCFLASDTPMVLLGFYVVCRMFGISLINMPINTWGMNALPNRYINHGNAVNNTLRQCAGSLGTALVVSAYSIYSGLAAASGASEIEAGIAGMNFAFVVQLILFVIGMIMTIALVRDKKGADACSENSKVAGDKNDADVDAQGSRSAGDVDGEVGANAEVQEERKSDEEQSANSENNDFVAQEPSCAEKKETTK